MRPSSPDDFLAAPVGRVAAGRTYFVWCPDRRLRVVALWGRSNAVDAQQLVRLFDVAFSPSLERPIDGLVDAALLDGVDPAGWRVLAEHLRARGAAFRGAIRRQALVRPDGLVGSVVSGFYDVLGRGFPVEVFTDRRLALRWLGRRDADACAAGLEARLDALAASGPVMRFLRELLHREHSDVSLAEAARALGLSTRVLQRNLKDARTTFRAEVAAARVWAAQVLLLDGDLKMTDVAMEVGCASLQHFSVLFRRVTGQSPSRWRARRAAGALV